MIWEVAYCSECGGRFFPPTSDPDPKFYCRTCEEKETS